MPEQICQQNQTIGGSKSTIKIKKILVKIKEFWRIKWSNHESDKSFGEIMINTKRAKTTSQQKRSEIF